MSGVFAAGLGAVSPAGWSLAAFRDILAKGASVPAASLPRPGWEQPLLVRPVPNPSPRPPFLSHPRLRRTSAISHYAAAAAWEALEQAKGRSTVPKPRLGLVVCLYCGCIQHSLRFYGEVLADPATASPLVFPETVFAAPASHLAALFEIAPLVSTLVGDPACFLQGLAVASDWLLEDRADLCLVVGAEEANWLLADAVWHFDRRAILSSGAGAICLGRHAEQSLGVELTSITSVHTYVRPQTRAPAARAMRQELTGAANTGEVLCDGLQQSRRSDAAEADAWADWTGPRLSPKKVLGEGLMAAAAWQGVSACDALAQGHFHSSYVSLVGCNQQAIGAQFSACPTS